MAVPRRRVEERTETIRATLESTADGILVVDSVGKIVAYNRKFAEMWRIPESVLASRDANVARSSVLSQLKDPDAFLTRVRQTYADHDAQTDDVIEFRDGRVFELHSEPQRLMGRDVGRVWGFRDVTERKRAEQALLLSEEKFAKAFRSSPNSMAISTLEEGRFLEVNDSFLRGCGRPREDVVGRTALELGVWVNPDDRVGVIDELRKSGRVNGREILLRSRSGQIWVGLFSAETIEVRGVDCLLTVAEDITERKRAEEALRDANRALTAISAVNEAVLHKTEEPLLLQEVCRCIVEHAGYRMAWVGFLNDGEPKRIYPVAEAGFEQGYLQSIDVRCDDSQRGRGPTGTAARTRKPAIVRNTATDAGFAPWRAEATARGYASVIGLPLVTGENLLGVLTIYSAQPDAFDEQEVRLLSELAGDLAFGIQALRTRAEQVRAEEALIEERHLLHTLMDNLPDTIYFKDRESRFTRINKALAKSFGLSDPAQAAAKTDSDFFTGEHAQQAYADEQEIIRTGQPVLGKEEKETWPDGRETWASTTKMPLRDAQGRIVGTFGISRDVTDRKRAEEALRKSEDRFRSLVENATVGIYRTTPDGHILMANPALVRMLGFDSFEELAARNLQCGGFESSYPALHMETDTQAASAVAEVILSRVVLEANRDGEKTVCHFNDGGSVLLSNFLAAFIRPGDEITFPLMINSAGAGTEIYIRTVSSSVRSRDLYQAPISYAAQPKADRREQLYVRSEVPTSRLGVSSIYLPCDVVRDYFYVATRRQPWEHQKSFYDVLRITPTSSLAELRVAFKLRQLEFRAAGTSNRDSATLERALNILAQPELRACYDSLLKDSSAPALFPYGGFGSILVAGDRSRDGQTFFATQILSFQPEHRERRFHARLRNFDFYKDHAIYRDVRRKLEVTLDQSVMPIAWDATWNQWRHLLVAKVELQGTFVQTGKYRHRNGQWNLVKWETALPSRIHVKLPAEITEQIETARRSYHRFGEFAEALEQIRTRIELEPMEREQLRSLCWDLGIPGDFDIAQITWKPDYDQSYYRQLCRRSRRLYLYRDEYIFDTPGGIAVETPQLGHATYLFSKPVSIEAFLAAYVATTKEAIRQNRASVAERLGFLGRVVHGPNPRLWLRALAARLGEAADYAQVASEGE